MFLLSTTSSMSRMFQLACKCECFIVTKLVLIVTSTLLKKKHLLGCFKGLLQGSKLTIFGAAHDILQRCILDIVQYLKWSFGFGK